MTYRRPLTDIAEITETLHSTWIVFKQSYLLFVICIELFPYQCSCFYFTYWSAAIIAAPPVCALTLSQGLVNKGFNPRWYIRKHLPDPVQCRCHRSRSESSLRSLTSWINCKFDRNIPARIWACYSQHQSSQ